LENEDALNIFFISAADSGLIDLVAFSPGDCANAKFGMLNDIADTTKKAKVISPITVNLIIVLIIIAYCIYVLLKIYLVFHLPSNYSGRGDH